MTTPPPVRWAVLGAANIAVSKVIPAMSAGSLTRVVGIASRSADRARAAAADLGIPRAYGSYDTLLADPDVEAVYIPLPNHLHVPWSLRAIEAGKHVLCEKPIALNAAEAETLAVAAERAGLLVGEAFMIRSHPQWLAVRRLIAEGRIGELTLVHTHFSYNRRDPEDVRSRVEWGGGVLYDIGCYAVHVARWLFGAEPVSVMALIDRDPEFGVDRLTSGMLRFERGRATFDVGGQIVPFQRVQIHGSRGRIEVEIPFNAPQPPVPSGRVFLDDGSRLGDVPASTLTFGLVDQYTRQADEFSAAVRGVGQVPVGVRDAVLNMSVIDALFRSASSGRWEDVSR